MSTSASDGQLRLITTGKTSFQGAIKLALKANPFAVGANVEGTRLVEKAQAEERVHYDSRIVQQETLGVFSWGFHVDDENARERGLTLIPRNLPRLDLLYDGMPSQNPNCIRVEVSSFWSLISQSDSWFTPAAERDLESARYSNRCQIIFLDVPQSLDNDETHIEIASNEPQYATARTSNRQRCGDLPVTPTVTSI